MATGKQEIPLSLRTSQFVLSCLVLPDSLQPMDCSPPGTPVHGIFQAGIQEWVAISFYRVLDPGLEPGSLALQADSLPSEPPGKL